MSERFDLALQAETRTVDVAQQLERQRGIALERVFDLGDRRVFLRELHDVDDGGVARADGLRLVELGAREEVAAKELAAGTVRALELFCRCNIARQLFRVV